MSTTWRLDNARIWSGHADHFDATSIDVVDGSIRAMGAPGGGMCTIDAHGAVVTPGLVDAHVHLLMGGESLLHVDLSDVTDRAMFEHRLESAHRALEPGRWLVAAGWDETRWDDPSLPDRTWFRCVEDRPAIAWRCDRHAVVVNEAVLGMLDIPGDEVMARRGGHVMRDGHGQPTGLMAEAAAWEMVNPLVPPLALAHRVKALERACTHLLELGITALRTMEYRRDVEAILMPRADTLPLRLSVVQLDRVLPLELDWIRNAPATDRFRITGCKSFFDGTLGSRTARLRSPYADDPSTRGTWTEHALRDEDGAWAQAVSEAGLAPVIHAIGDEAVCRAASVLQAIDPALRPTVEHAEIVDARDLGLLEGLRTSVQPVHRADDAHMAPERLGDDRAGRVLPLRDMIDAGALMSFGTDWPIVDVDPMPGLIAAVHGTRRDGAPFFPEQAVTPLEAMRAQTIHASEAIGMPGGLAAGGPADLVIWNGNPLEDPVGASVRATVVDGTLVAGSWPGQEDRCRD